MAINAGGANSDVINVGYFFKCSLGDESLITFAQNVELQILSDGTESLIVFAQTVEAVADGTESLITFAQNVRSVDAPSTFLSRNGYTVDIYINDVLVPAGQIHGVITINKVESEANTMNFTIIPPRGVQNLVSYEGSRVRCVIETAARGAAIQTFTGTIDVPNINLIERKIAISCTNNRQNIINGQVSSASIASIGVYDSGVFGNPSSVVDELDKRLSTSSYISCFDGYNQLIIHDAFAKATPDYTYLEDDIYRENNKDISIKLLSRSKIVNTVNIGFQHRRNRLWHQDTTFQWAVDWTGVCDFLTYGYTMPLKSSITAAQQATGWVLNSPMTFTEFYRSGYYSCDGATAGFSLASAQYKTVPSTSTAIGKDLSDVTTNDVDSNGNPIYKVVTTSYQDYSALFCLAASWVSSKRWSQNLVESYSLSVTSSQSLSQFGEVIASDNSSSESDYNVNDWTNYTTYSVPVGGTSTAGGGIYIDDSYNIHASTSGMNCLLNKAKYTILKAHRENRVSFNIYLDPAIELYHTIRIEATSREGSYVIAKGKVRQVTHTLDVGTGDCNTYIEMALSLASGSATNTPLQVPNHPTSTPNSVDLSGVYLGNHWGELPTPSMNGMIGNKYTGEVTGSGINYFKTNYTTAFVVDTPVVPQSMTETVTYTSNSNYSVALINDELSVTL